ncbi:hypothetical protein [Micromonospora sp. NPDC126480]|uniref:hypothetical protein n=1 Tax=Micromonospora sp. NPDC126480 TaxID=3155312 RepID=UPI00332CEDB9
MRLTVGPLPPAVYWRRRAVVLGAVLLLLIVVLYSCSRSDDDPGRPGGTAASSGATPDPTGSVLTPRTGTPSPGDGSDDGSGDAGGDGPSATPSSGATTTNGPVPVAPVVDAGTCTDEEIKVTAVARPATVSRGAAVDLQLKIRNSSDRTCSRDVGADLQELFIKSGAATVWSSDTCGTGKGSDVQSFTPNFERSYQLTWNGKDASRCADGVAAGPVPPAGTYQVLARVGTKLSAPVRLTITG